MSTIKIQNGNVITKDGKVSCSCCITGCCMYSAQGLADGLYGEADLPDTLEILPYDDNSSEFVIATRTGQIYGPVNFEFSEQYQQKIEFVPDYELLGPRWTFQIKSTNDAPWVIDDNAVTCLFGPINESDLAARDTFEDDYKVEAFNENNALIGTDTYFRSSLCQWLGSEANSRLTFNSNEGSANWGWNARFAGLSGRKDGPQNSPVGNYPVLSGEFQGWKLVVSIPE